MLKVFWPLQWRNFIPKLFEIPPVYKIKKLLDILNFNNVYKSIISLMTLHKCKHALMHLATEDGWTFLQCMINCIFRSSLSSLQSPLLSPTKDDPSCGPSLDGHDHLSDGEGEEEEGGEKSDSSFIPYQPRPAAVSTRISLCHSPNAPSVLFYCKMLRYFSYTKPLHDIPITQVVD